MRSSIVGLLGEKGLGLFRVLQGVLRCVTASGFATDDQRAFEAFGGL